MNSRNSEALGVSEARGARAHARYLQDPDTRVYQTDSFEEDNRVQRTDSSEGDITQGKEKKNFVWSKKKYWIIAISVIPLLFLSLTLGLGLYFDLYYEKHDIEGNFSIRMLASKFLPFLFSEY